MKVNELMTREVRTVTPDRTIQDAARLMGMIDAGFLPVADDDRLVGTITDRDIAIRCIAEGKGPETLVSDAMPSAIPPHANKFMFQQSQ